jgi:beta-lactamase class A
MRKSRHAATLAAALLAVGCAPVLGGGQSAAPHGSGTHSSAPSRKTVARGVLTSPFISLDGYLAHRSGEVTAALYDAESGHTWLLNPQQVQDTASIVKVEIMATAFQEAEAVHEQLPQTEAALMAPMIENSDNQAATELLQDVGGPGAVALFDRSADMNHTTPSTLALVPGTPWPGWGLTTTTALDEVTLISRLAYANAVLSRSFRRYGLSLMERVEQDQDWGVSAGVPRGTTIALKNGWLPLSSSDWQVNSIGWVDGNGRNYVLAVLTRGSPTEGYGIATIQTVARTVFAQLGGP